MTIVFSYYITNIALKYYSSGIVMPVVKILSMLHNIVSGGIFLSEFGDYSEDKIGLAGFVTGIAVCIFGIVFLVVDEHRQSDKR